MRWYILSKADHGRLPPVDVHPPRRRLDVRLPRVRIEEEAGEAEGRGRAVNALRGPGHQARHALRVGLFEAREEICADLRGVGQEDDLGGARRGRQHLRKDGVFVHGRRQQEKLTTHTSLCLHKERVAPDPVRAHKGLGGRDHEHVRPHLTAQPESLAELRKDRGPPRDIVGVLVYICGDSDRPGTIALACGGWRALPQRGPRRVPHSRVSGSEARYAWFEVFVPYKMNEQQIQTTHVHENENHHEVRRASHHLIVARAYMAISRHIQLIHDFEDRHNPSHFQYFPPIFPKISDPRVYGINFNGRVLGTIFVVRRNLKSTVAGLWLFRKKDLGVKPIKPDSIEQRA